MQKFILDCEAISSIETDLNNLKSKVIDVESSINEYELEDNNDFDFLEVKNAITTNINNVGNKIYNTINLLETVVNTHTDIQNKIKITYYEELSFDFKNKK